MTVQDEQAAVLLQIYELFSRRLGCEILDINDFKDQVQKILTDYDSLPLINYFNREFPEWKYCSAMIAFMLSTMVRGDDGQLNLALIDDSSLADLISDESYRQEVLDEVSLTLATLSFSNKIELTSDGWRLSDLERENLGRLIKGDTLRKYIKPKSN